MNVLVFSDSHGNSKNIKEAIDRQIKKPDAVIFLGDGIRDILYLDFDDIDVYCVAGNCDFGMSAADGNIPDEQIVCVRGKKLLIAHGHRYDVKNGLSRLIKRAVDCDVDIVLFGHTHICIEKTLLPDNNEYDVKLHKPLRIMNPGSIGHYPNSWGCIEINYRGEVLMSHGALL